MPELKQIPWKNLINLLNEISESILREDDLNDALNTIIRLVVEELDAYAGTIAKPDQSGEALQFIAEYNRDPERVKALNSSDPLPIGVGAAGNAYLRQERFEIDDTETHPEFTETFRQHARDEGFQALISQPLIAHDDCLGVVTLYFQQSRHFDEEFRQVFGYLGKKIALAMRHGQLIDELEAKNDRLQKLADTDGLTGLPNHRKIQNILREELSRCQRYGNSLSVMMVDIDDFKSVNDNHGHIVGDEVLKELGQLFEEKLRSTDSVGRYGGEEFLFVLPETTVQEAYELAERLRAGVEEMTVEVEGITISITISLGIAELPQNAQLTSAEIIDRSDEALYEAKHTGKNRSVRYDEFHQRDLSDYKPYAPS